MEWKNIYRGMIMGVSDVVPGVSGGTIAVILGIYDQLIAAINGLFSKEWKKHIAFLIPLAIGVGLAIFLFSKVMNYLLANHEQVTYYFFMGLIIGILPYLFREARMTGNLKWHHILMLVLGIILISLLPSDAKESGIIYNVTGKTYLLLFFSGVLASGAMILPGISGSFVLVVLGVYKTVINAVSTLDIKILIVVAIGIGIGIITMSKIIHFFLKHYRIATFSFIIGLVIGSIYLIFPGWAENASTMIYSIILFAVGLAVAYILGKVEY